MACKSTNNDLGLSMLYSLVSIMQLYIKLQYHANGANKFCCSNILVVKLGNVKFCIRPYSKFECNIKEKIFILMQTRIIMDHISVKFGKLKTLTFLYYRISIVVTTNWKYITENSVHTFFCFFR